MRKTDYKNLDLFEASAVAVAAAGIFLVGVISFSNLDERHQQAVASAFEMFDVHEEAVEQVDAMHAMLFEIPEVALNGFYVAFSNVVTPSAEMLSWVDTLDQQVRVALTNSLEFSDRVAIAFSQTIEKNNSYLLPDPGRVAGASVFTESPPEEDVGSDVLLNIMPDIPVGFKAPSDPRSSGYTPPKLPEFPKNISPIKF